MRKRKIRVGKGSGERGGRSGSHFNRREGGGVVRIPKYDLLALKSLGTEKMR